MRTILGIDAAWTASQPSGVALVEGSAESGWSCLCVAPSYDAFMDACHGKTVEWGKACHRGCEPDIPGMLSMAKRLTGGRKVDLAGVDMPLACEIITARREADNAVSRRFSAVGCGTHSPTPERPGPLGARLTCAFRDAGYPVIAAGQPAGTIPGILEVYPHPALMTLLDEEYRLPYKQSKSTKYWPDKSLRERISELLKIYQRILKALSSEISGIELPLPDYDECRTLASLKQYEDSLDALVCAWIGCRYVEGRAEACGDIEGAVWVPS